LKQLPINQIICGDCFEVLKTFPDESIDLVVADPPYMTGSPSIELHFPKSGGKPLNLQKGVWDIFTVEEYEKFMFGCLTEIKRILKNDHTLWIFGNRGGGIYIIGYLLKKLGFYIINEVLYHKLDATPNLLSKNRMVDDHENILWARKGDKHYFSYELSLQYGRKGKQLRSLWSKGKTKGGKRNLHPAQKPEWLIERILLLTSEVDDVILDPFVGSGTTCAVAKSLKRRWIGIEKERKYCEIAEDRLKRTLKPLSSLEGYFVTTNTEEV